MYIDNSRTTTTGMMEEEMRRTYNQAYTTRVHTSSKSVSDMQYAFGKNAVPLLQEQPSE